jgi:hypothetical protein
MAVHDDITAQILNQHGGINNKNMFSWNEMPAGI